MQNKRGRNGQPSPWDPAGSSVRRCGSVAPPLFCKRERDGKLSLFCFALSQKRERPFARFSRLSWVSEAPNERTLLHVLSRLTAFLPAGEQVLPTPPGTAGRKRAHGFREFPCKKITSQFRNPEPRAHYAHAREGSRNGAANSFRNAAGIPPPSPCTDPAAS